MADANKLIAENTRKINDNAKAWNKLIDPLNKATAATKQAVEVQKQLNTQLKNAKTSKEFATAQKQIEGNIKAVSLAEKEAIRVLAEAEKLKRQRIQTERALNKQVTAQAGSINALRQSNSRLRKERNNLNLTTKEGQKRLKELNKEINKNDKAINKNNDALSQQRANIGNYSSALSGIGGAAGNAVNGIMSVTRAAAAFIATPLGVVIAAIVIALKAMSTYFTSSEAGQNRWNKIMNAGGVILGNLSDIFSDFGEALLSPLETLRSIGDWFENTFGNLIMGIVDRNVAVLQKNFALVGVAWEEMVDVFTDNSNGIAAAQAKVDAANQKVIEANERIQIGMGEVSAAYEDGKAAVSAFVDEQVREIAISNELSDLEAKRDLLNRKLIVDQEKLRTKARELRLQAEQAEAEERIRLLQEAFDVETELGRRREEVAEINLELKREQNKLSNSTKEDLDEEARLEAELFRIQQERLKKQKTLQTQINTETNKLNADSLANYKKTEAEKTKALEDEEAKRTEHLKAEEEKRTAIRNQAKSSAIEASAEILSENLVNSSEKVEAEIALNQEELSRKLEDESLTADQRDALKEQFAKKEAKLKNKQAKAEKADSIFKIGIDTAANIVKVFPNPALMIAAGITGATQAAVVASRPLPKFDKGTTNAPTGGFWAGEKRPEFMMHNGQLSYIDKPTMFGNESAGATIIGGEKTAQIMEQIGRDETISGIKNDKAVQQTLLNAALLRATDKQTKAIVGAINNQGKQSGMDKMISFKNALKRRSE